MDITLNPVGNFSSGDNDIACSSATTNFTKNGQYTATFNTINSQWLGGTIVNEGAMIIGGSGDNTSAVWGNPNSPSFNSTSLRVDRGATMGGFGTVYTSIATFKSGSTFFAGLSNPDTPVLSNTVAIYLDEGSYLVVEPASNSLPEGTYKIASNADNNSDAGIWGTFASASVSTTNNLNLQYEIDKVIYYSNDIQVKLNKTSTISSQNAFDQVDTVTDVLTQVGGGNVEISNPNDDFVAHFNLANLAPLKNRQYAPTMALVGQSSSDRLANVLQAVSKNGPVIMSSDQYRVWLSPYYSHGNTDSFDGQPAVRDHYEGVLIGAEKRSLKNNWTIGVLTGVGTGNATLPQYINTNIRDKSGFFGLYHSLGFLEHARYDIILNSIFTNHHMQRSGKLDVNTPYLALADYKSRTLSGNFETSYQFKMQDHSSFRPNLGFTYAENT